jgi:hypothetical protein
VQLLLESLVTAILLLSVACLVLVRTAFGQIGQLPRTGCRPGNPLANVRDPERLKLVRPCIAVHGFVRSVQQMGDGDFHVNLELDPEQQALLNGRNIEAQNGQLVTEIVPADQPGCTPGQPPKLRLGAWVRLWEMHSGHFDLGICTGANIASPPIGARVEIVGPYVLDANHGWMEIHPVWSVKLLNSVR